MSYDPVKAVRYVMRSMAHRENQSRQRLFQTVREAIIAGGVPVAAAPLSACILDVDQWKSWFKKKGVPIVRSAKLAEPGDIAILDFRVIMIVECPKSTPMAIDWTGRTITLEDETMIALMHRGNNFG